MEVTGRDHLFGCLVVLILFNVTGKTGRCRRTETTLTNGKNTEQDRKRERDDAGVARGEERLQRVWRDHTRAFVGSQHELIISVEVKTMTVTGDCEQQGHEGRGLLAGGEILLKALKDDVSG